MAHFKHINNEYEDSLQLSNEDGSNLEIVRLHDQDDLIIASYDEHGEPTTSKVHIEPAQLSDYLRRQGFPGGDAA